MKNLKNNIYKIDFFLIFFLTIYTVAILTWYYKPPWFIDHLTYVLTALPQDINDLKFWHTVSPNLPEGTLSERWAVLVPIIIFNKILFFLPPHLSSQAFIISVWIFILIFSYIFVKKEYSPLHAKIFLIIFVLGIHHTKNRATEILADPVGVLLVIMLFMINSFYTTKLKYYFIGILFLLIPLTKIHYGIFIIIFIFFNFKKTLYALPKIIYGFLGGVIFCELVFFINYDLEMFYQINLNTYETIKFYFMEGDTRWSSMSGDKYWSTLWLETILSHLFLPPIFLILFIKYLFKPNKNLMFENLTISFLILLLFFSYFVSFPNNDSYAYPIFIFSIIFFTQLIVDIKPKHLSNIKYIQIILIIFVMIYPVSYYCNFNSCFTPKHKLLLDEFLFVFSIIYIPIVLINFNNALRFILIMPIIFISFFSHNYYYMKIHQSWKIGYNSHYQYLNATVDLIKEKNSNYLIVYESWPMYGKKYRESLYPKLGLQNMTRKNITVNFLSDKIKKDDSIVIKDFIITDYLISEEIIENLNIKLLNKKNFLSNTTNRPERKINLFLYKKQI